jgi:peptide-methionine (S)-S-oxide reductase
MSSLSSKITLGAGCYWGTEKYIRNDFQKRFPGSLKTATVGFMSPKVNHMKNPTYKQVCSGSSGHVEVLEVELNDPSEHMFEELIKFFFMFHDPTTMNRQGNDRGTQYASAIFVSDDEQKKIVNKVIEELQSAIDVRSVKYSGKNISTGVHDYTEFYPAHKEHQEYLAKNPSGYCNHYLRMKVWPSKVDVESGSAEKKMGEKKRCWMKLLPFKKS